MKFNPTKWRTVADPYFLNVDYRKDVDKNLLSAYGYANNNTGGVGKLDFGSEIRWRAYYENGWIRISDDVSFNERIIDIVEAPGVLSLDLDFDTSGNPIVIFHQSEYGNDRASGIYVAYKNAYTQLDDVKQLANIGQDVCITWYNKSDERSKDLVAFFLDPTSHLIKYACLSSNFNTVISTNIKSTHLTSAFAVLGRQQPELSPGYNMGPTVGLRYTHRIPDLLMKFTGASGTNTFTDKFRGTLTNYSYENAAINSTTPGKPNGVLSLVDDQYGITTFLVTDEIQPKSDMWSFRLNFKMTAVGTQVGTLLGFIGYDGSNEDQFGVYITSGANPRLYFRNYQNSTEANIDPNGIPVQLDTWTDIAVIRLYDRIVYYVNQLPVSSKPVTREMLVGSPSTMIIGARFTGLIEWLEFKTESSDRWITPTRFSPPQYPVNELPPNLLMLLDLRDSRNYDYEYDEDFNPITGNIDSSSYHRAFDVLTISRTTLSESNSSYFGASIPPLYQDSTYSGRISIPYYDPYNPLATTGSTADFKNLTGWLVSIWIFNPQYSNPYNLGGIFSMSNEAPGQTEAPDVGTQGAFIADSNFSYAQLGNESGKNCPVFIRGAGFPNPTVIWGGTPLKEKVWTQVDYLYWDNYLTIYTDGKPNGGGPLPGGLLDVAGAFRLFSLASDNGPIAQPSFYSTGFQFWRLNNSTDVYYLNNYRSLYPDTDRLLEPFVY